MPNGVVVVKLSKKSVFLIIYVFNQVHHDRLEKWARTSRMVVMTTLEVANDFYKAQTNSKVLSPSLVSFLKQSPVRDWVGESLQRGAGLELGCGPYSLFEIREELFGAKLCRGLYACDISDVAIDQAPEETEVEYFTHNILEELPEKYQVIIDGHCLHTLASLPELYFALGLIHKSMEEGGYFIGEVMMSHKNMSFEPHYDYIENERVLYRYGSPHRMIMTSREWEDLFVTSGFKIEYFMCQSSIKFIPSTDRTEALVSDPECLRFVLKKEVSP